MSRITKNFNSDEFKCDCGCERSFVTKELADALQELRDRVGVPIKILSGYRCIKRNQEAGGGKNSQHLYGKAADIYIHGMSVRQMYEAALKVSALVKGGIGIYPLNNFIHVDVRQVPARWARIKNNKYVGIEEGMKHAV